MENVLSVYDQPPLVGRGRICFDERPCQLLDDVVAALPTKPGKTAKEDNEYVRKGTCVVLFAYDLDTGQRFTQVRDKRTKADYAEFMYEVISTHYADIEQIDLIQDKGTGPPVEYPQIRFLLRAFTHCPSAIVKP